MVGGAGTDCIVDELSSQSRNQGCLGTVRAMEPKHLHQRDRQGPAQNVRQLRQCARPRDQRLQRRRELRHASDE